MKIYRMPISKTASVSNQKTFCMRSVGLVLLISLFMSMLAVNVRVDAEDSTRALASIALVMPDATNTPTIISSSISELTGGIVPINWELFTKGKPTDPEARLWEALLLNANHYALTTWYNTDMGFADDIGSYLELGPVEDYSVISFVAVESLAIAISLKTQVYDPTVVGVSESDALIKSIRLITSATHTHVSNLSSGWGNSWASSAYASRLGFAAWLLWDQLSDQDRTEICNMLDYEADHLLK
jgi:hypothetical protein